MFILREIKEDVSFTPVSERILNHYLGREYEVVKYDSPFYNELWKDFELDHNFPELIDKKPLLSKEEFSILERDIKSNIFFIRAPERVKGQEDYSNKVSVHYKSYKSPFGYDNLVTCTYYIMTESGKTFEKL